MEYLKKRKWAILGVIMLYAISIALLYFQDDLKREIALMNIKEGAQKVDTSMICFEEDSPMGYSEWFAQNGGGASPIPLMTLDKQSDEVEIFLSYPKHYPHTEYFDGPEVDGGLIPKNDPRNPIGKWIGKGLLSQPPGWWHPKMVNPHNMCKVKTPQRVDEPATLWFILMFPLLYLLRKVDM